MVFFLILRAYYSDHKVHRYNMYILHFKQTEYAKHSLVSLTWPYATSQIATHQVLVHPTFEEYGIWYSDWF